MCEEYSSTSLISLHQPPKPQNQHTRCDTIFRSNVQPSPTLRCLYHEGTIHTEVFKDFFAAVIKKAGSLASGLWGKIKSEAEETAMKKVKKIDPKETKQDLYARV